MKNEDILDEISANIRAERVRKKYTQQKLAELVGITQKYLNMIENSKVNPSISIVIKICKALNVDLNTIWHG